MEYTYSRYTGSDHDLSSSTYNGLSSALYDGASVDPHTLTVRRLDPTKLINADQAGATKFQLGDINPVYGGVRQPGRISSDMSFMKAFPIRGEGRYVQFRAEAANVFNQRGMPNFTTDPRAADYGLMNMQNGFNQRPREMQMSLRIIF
jgi:hypothetical protein